MSKDAPTSSVRLVWALVGAWFGSNASVALTLVLVFSANALQIHFLVSRGIVFVVVFGVPIFIGALLGLTYPHQTRNLAFKAAGTIERLLDPKAKRRG